MEKRKSDDIVFVQSRELLAILHQVAENWMFALKSEAKYALKELADVEAELLISKREDIISDMIK